MTNKFIQPGDTLSHTPGSNVAGGQIVVIGARVGIALADIAANKSGSIAVEGVFSYAKASADTMAQGALVYFSSANNNLTTTASGNTLAGFAADAAGAGATSVKVKINA